MNNVSDRQDVSDMLAILSAMAETSESVIASTLYLAVNCDMARYERATELGKRLDFLIVTDTKVTLTQAGRKAGETVTAHLAKHN